VPADRLAALRAAFAATAKDAQLLDEAERQKIDVTYRAPQDLLAIVDQLYATPKDRLDKAAELVPSGD
jgi:hypothetical protein